MVTEQAIFITDVILRDSLTRTNTFSVSCSHFQAAAAQKVIVL